MCGPWKSGTVARGSPRSRPTTLRPARVSSRPSSVPTRPTPSRTASVAGRRVATLFPLAHRHQVHVAMTVGGKALGRTGKGLVMPVDQRIIVGVGAGKADHFPRRHAVIAAVGGIAE